MANTPVYGLPYQTLTDIPQGAALGQNLADAVETELARIDAARAGRLQMAQIVATSVTIIPVANTPTSGAVSWGTTLSGTVRAVVTVETGGPGSSVREASVTNVTTTGCTVWVYRVNTSSTRVQVLAVGGL